MRLLPMIISMETCLIGCLFFSIVFFIRALFLPFETEAQLNTFWIQLALLVYMSYCTILYLLATVIRDSLCQKKQKEEKDQLKKCLMVMFGMDSVLKISIMIVGWYLVDDIKAMYFFLSLEILSSLIVFFVFIPATPVFHMNYNRWLVTPILLLLIPYAFFTLWFLIYLPVNPVEVYSWAMLFMGVSIPLAWFSIFDFLSVWWDDFELGDEFEESPEDIERVFESTGLF